MTISEINNTEEMRTLSQKVWRGLHNQLSGIYQYLHLVFGTSAYQPTAPSDETVNLVNSLFALLQQLQSVRDSALIVRAVELLNQCEDLDALPEVLNESGFNLMQQAVLHDDTDFLLMLIQEGLNLNKGKCSLPLHLTCKVGNLPLVKFLLHHGADPNMEIGMCYPKPHLPVRHVPSRFHFLETDIFSCDSDHQLPVMYAIQEDHLQVVRCLIDEGGHWPSHRRPLHHACKYGAFNSMRYLTEIRPQEVRAIDHQGWTPLLHAVQWGRRFVEYMEENGSDMHARTPSEQTALHLLFQKVCDPSELYDTSRFLLGTGLEEDVNAVDCSGNSALHALIGQVNRGADSFPTSSTEDLNQDDFNLQVLETLRLLLGHNCDPNIVNNSGITSLHKLILTFDFVISNDPAGITLETLPMREKYCIDLDTLHDAMGMLLSHGADPNTATGAGRTPLVLLLHSMLDVDPTRLPEFHSGLLHCLQLLCEKGARPSDSPSTHSATISTISKLCQRCLLLRDPAVKETMHHFIKDVLSLLLSQGLDSNRRTLIRRKEQQTLGSCNLLIELVKLAQHIRQPSDFSFIHDWTLIAMQWGADPDIEPYPSDPIICHSQSSIFLKPKSTQPVNHFMYQIQDFVSLFEGGHAEKLLMLFYSAMDHEALFSCLNTAKFMSRFDPTSTKTPSHGFIRLINSLGSHPRSLQQISRVAVYKAMDRQLKLRTHHLPLPPPIQNFILNIQ
ncbi:hypothetical protein CAPTEDRAFT_194797 [Capitella teleta]|uniref:SOCS box domain-containing protein n=1 Tax=Capitella teleta TaxID=283909 RepID=R7UZH1_CAPTE|nr:hypothetical protein CAPTEDRAFT_194797 [Capitella teleta]|eukprot:ELU09362.1 hypothetical protein CAPTEDRAFT_194797 [Capitella teleta]